MLAQEPLNILLVDDRSDGITTLQAVLKNPGYNLVTASGGPDALRLLLKQEFVLILLDVQMPGMDGFETAALIKTQETLQHIPIIFVTGVFGDTRHTHHGYKVGAIDYITKPYDPYVLQSKVAVLVDLHRKTQLLRQIEKAGHERHVLELRRKLELEHLRRRERELSDFLENATIGLQWIGPDGSVLWANKADLDLLGYSASEYIGQPIRKFHADESVIDDIIHRLNANEPVHNYVAPMRCKDGSIKDVAISSSVYRENGEFIHTRSFTYDVTSQKHAEAVLRKAHENASLLAAIVESSNDAVFSETLDGVITSWNTASERLYGYSTGEAVGTFAGCLYPEENKADVLKLIDLVKEGERVENHETVRLRKDGTRVDVSITVSPIRNPNEICGVSIITRDITERKQAEEKLRRASEELNRSNKELEHFAHVVSHDLKEPLRMVNLYVELLKSKYDGKLDLEAKEFMGYAIDGARRMQNLIDDLLKVSKVGTERRELEPIDLGWALEAAKSNLQVMITEAGAQVTCEELPTVKAEPTEIIQVFQNLIANAIKFRKHAPPRIHISAEKSAEECRIEVQDNGIGIKPEDKEKIFIIFQRLHSREEYPGTG